MVSADGGLLMLSSANASRTFQPKILISNNTATKTNWRRPLHSLLERSYTLPATTATMASSTSMITDEPMMASVGGSLQHMLLYKRQKTTACPMTTMM